MLEEVKTNSAFFVCVLRHHAAYPSNVQSGKNGGTSVNVSLS